MLGVDYDDESDTEATQMSDLKRDLSVKLTQSDLIEQLKNKILLLEEWKKEEGIPAIEENKRLNEDIMRMEQNEILQNNEILAIKQENQRLQLELDEYENEHNKLEIERTHLLTALDEVELEASISKKEEEHWANSVKEQYHKIDTLSKQRRKSNSDLQLSQKTISELLEENNTLKSKNDELKLINNKNQQTISETNEKLKTLELQYNELIKKHEVLGMQYQAEKEKTQKISHDLIANLLHEYNETKPGSTNSSNGSYQSPNALPILFNPKTLSIHTSQHDIGILTAESNNGSNPSSNTALERLSNASTSPKFDFARRRSRSFDSDASHDRIIMRHIENFEEKEAFDLNHHDGIYDEEKLRHEIEQDLIIEFEKERREWNDKYDTMQRKFKKLQRKYNRAESARQRILDDSDGECNELLINEYEDINDVVDKKGEQALQKDKKSNCLLAFFPFGCSR